MTDSPKRFALFVAWHPSSDASRTILALGQAIVRSPHVLARVFFQLDGVHHANPDFKDSPVVKGWLALAESAQVPLLACSSAAQEAGLTGARAPGLTPPTELAGLGSYAESLLDCDVVLSFGLPGEDRQ